MKTFTINGKDVEFTDCTFISDVDGSTQYGLYIHEVDDENRDGDMVISNGCEMPENDEDAEAILFNETGCSDSDVLKTVHFMTMIPLKEYAQRNGRDPATARQMALRGNFKTATKVGRDWFIDENEPYPDHRRKE